MAILATETWTGSNGDPWPSTHTTGATGTAATATIESNAGRLRVTGDGVTDFDTTRAIARRVNIASQGPGNYVTKFTIGTTPPYTSFQFRQSGTALDGNGYFIVMGQGGSVTVELWERTGGTDTVIGSVAKTLTLGTAYWLRAHFVGSALRFRIWADGGSEPGTWDVDVTDTVHSSGYMGWSIIPQASASAQDLTLDDLTLTDASDTLQATSTATSARTATAGLTAVAAVSASTTASATASASVAAAVQAFPEGLLPVTVELLGVETADVWADVTTYVRYQEGIQIRRGRSGEGRQTDTTSVQMTLDNRDHRFTPRNPSGPYYGRLGRNTQGRVSITVDDTWLALDGTGSSTASTPDSAGLSITGDIDIRIDAWLWSWKTGATGHLMLKGAAGNRSYRVFTDAAGTVSLVWSADGTNELTITSTQTVPVPLVGRKRVRVTLDVNNGAAGRTGTFYTADPDDGTLATTTWTQLGDAVTQSGTTSIFDGTAALTVFTNIPARYYALEVRDGIAGTVRANPDFTAQTAGAGSFSDGTNTWTIGAAADLVDADIRAWFEVPAWPRKRDISGNDEWVPVEGAGIMRRMGAGSSPLNSTLRRGILSTSTSGVQEYWPCEDGDTATRLASAVGGPAMVMNGTAANLAAFDGFDCSLPLPTLVATTELRGAVRTHPTTGFSQVRCLIAIPDTGTVNGASLLEVNYTGSAATWQVRYGTGGTLTIRAFDGSGTSLLTNGPSAFGMDDTARWISLELTQTGADIDWAVKVLDPGATVGTFVSGTVAGQTFGRPTRVTGSPGGGTEGVSMGHFVVQDEITSLFDLGDELAAWAGETAGRRVERLCGEEGLDFRVIADLDDTVAMGPQGARTLLDLLRECEEADGGILYEPRDTFGLAYRPRSSMYSLPASLTLDHAQHQLAAPLDPVPDDQTLTNDVTVSRTDGSSARAEDTTGPLSTQAPPDGVGRYDSSVTVNVQTDDVLDDQAGWRLHLGTVDEDRHPSIQVRLSHPEFSGDAALTADVRGLDLGDRFLVQNPPSGEPPEDVDQLAQGFGEKIDQKTHDIGVNTAPARPWRVPVLDAGTAGGYRYASDTVTAEALDDSETGVDVTVSAGQPGWSVADGSFDVMIGGERMTVTAVSGTAPTQTFTVTRSVNGVVKSHATGATVTLFEPSYWGL